MYYEQEGDNDCVLVGGYYNGPYHFFKNCLLKNVTLYKEIIIKSGLGEESDPLIRSFDRTDHIIELNCMLFEIDKENLMLLKLYGTKDIKLITKKISMFDKIRIQDGSNIFIKSL
jgi:hypothetical protein